MQMIPDAEATPVTTGKAQKEDIVHKRSRVHDKI